MSTPSNPPSELPNTYLVQDRSQQKELMRVHLQDQLLTASMGGVLPEQADVTILHLVPFVESVYLRLTIMLQRFWE